MHRISGGDPWADLQLKASLTQEEAKQAGLKTASPLELARTLVHSWQIVSRDKQAGLSLAAQAKRDVLKRATYGRVIISDLRWEDHGWRVSATYPYDVEPSTETSLKKEALAMAQLLYVTGQVSGALGTILA